MQNQNGIQIRHHGKITVNSKRLSVKNERAEVMAGICNRGDGRLSIIVRFPHFVGNKTDWIVYLDEIS